MVETYKHPIPSQRQKEYRKDRGMEKESVEGSEILFPQEFGSSAFVSKEYKNP